MESTYRVEWVSGSEGIFEDVMTGIFQVWIYIYIYIIWIMGRLFFLSGGKVGC